MPLNPVQRASLRSYLANRFSLSELETLAFNLGLDYDSLRHHTKEEFSLDLLAHFERDEKLPALINLALQKRHDDEIAALLARLNPAPAQIAATPPVSALSASSKEAEEFGPEFAGPEQLLEFSRQLLTCHAMSDKTRRGQVRSLLPNDIRLALNDEGSAFDQVLSMVQTSDRYPDGNRHLLKAVRAIEGDSKAWRELVKYLGGLNQPKK